jgi:NADH:ubiquinone oxidoreductase subunit 3 (subunit A)
MQPPIQTTAGIEPAFALSDYFPLFLYFLVVLAFVTLTLFFSRSFLGLKPRKDTIVKLMPYESGVDPIGSARMQFDVKFYLIAILFLVFDVELLFLYPWAVIAYSEGSDPAWKATFGRIVFIEIMIFLVTLVIAYVYAWRKGVFQWR